MKTTIKCFFKGLVILYRYIWSYDKSHKVEAMLNYMYSLWLSSEFASCGKSVSFKKPVSLRGQDCIFIGDNSSFHKNVVLTAWKDYEGETFSPQIVIGDNCNIGEYCHITAINCIVLGNGVLTGRWVTITDNSHGETDYETLKMQPILRKLSSKGAVKIGDNVWIGDKVTILPNVTIGNGAIIAANAVVTRDIPPYSIVAGNPARIIKQY